jgi:hypothetical protein
MKVITKAEFIDLYERGLLFDIVSTPIAIVCKKIVEPSDPPSPKVEAYVVNVP